MKHILPFNLDDVDKIYRGVDRCCRCGCGGEYYYRGEPEFDFQLKAVERNFKRKPEDKQELIGYHQVKMARGKCIAIYVKGFDDILQPYLTEAKNK